MYKVFRFSNCLATGRFGPTQEQVNTAYASTVLNGKVTVNTQGVQEWIVPYTGKYIIESVGASGGDYNSLNGGKGAKMSGVFELEKGSKLFIIVGQRGQGSLGSGGGGGSFVSNGVSLISSALLIAAGGGGGYGSSGSGSKSAVTTKDGLVGLGGAYAGGVDGQGGQTASGSGWGGAGAGWKSNGGNGGALGGVANSPTNPSNPAVGGPGGGNGAPGGFGGGGGGGQNGGGGGGGYSGGGCSAGGGGSFNSGTEQNNLAEANIGDGYINITYLKKSQYPEFGHWVSDPIGLSVVGSVGTSSISWSQTVPEGTSVIVKAALMTGGLQPEDEDFVVCYPNTPIPGMTEELDVSDCRLFIKVSMTSSNIEVTPIVSDIQIRVGSYSEVVQLQRIKR